MSSEQIAAAHTAARGAYLEWFERQDGSNILDLVLSSADAG
jgi:hypothetical protein